jgi:Tfp pilus assembly PilM family ATPase
VHRLKRCLGVDLGTGTVKLVELAREKETVRVLRAVSVDLELLPNTPPEERAEATAEAVRNLVRDNKITTKQAVFSVPGQAVFIKRRHLPRTSDERLHRIINFEARQQIPFPLDKTLLEYQVFDEPGSPNVEVLMVAIKRDFVETFMRTVTRTKLKPVHVTVSTLALFNALHFDAAADEMLRIGGAKEKKAKSDKPAKGGGFLKGLGKGKKEKVTELSGNVDELDKIASEDADAEGDIGEDDFDLGDMDLGIEDVKAHMHIGASTLDIIITRFGQRKQLGFTRSVPIAGNEVTKMIMDRLRLESFAEAEQTKKNRCAVVSEEGDLSAVAPEADDEAAAGAAMVANRLIAEVRRTLDFYVSQPDGVTVDSVMISGGAALLTNLGPYIEEKLGLMVEVNEGPTTERFSAEEPPAEGWSVYLPALGMGLIGLGLGKATIDFLPTNLKDIRHFKSKVVEIVVLAACLGVSLGLSMRMGEDDKKWYEGEIERMANQISQWGPQLAAGQEALSSRDAIKTQFDAIEPLLEWRMYWPRIYDQVVRKWVPAQIYLTKVEFTAWGMIRIQGVASDDGAISDYERNITENAQDLISTNDGDVQVQLLGSTRSRGGREMYTFEIYLRALTRKSSRTVEYRDIWPQSQEDPMLQQRRGGAPRGGIYYDRQPVPNRGAGGQLPG